MLDKYLLRFCVTVITWKALNLLRLKKFTQHLFNNHPTVTALFCSAWCPLINLLFLLFGFCEHQIDKILFLESGLPAMRTDNFISLLALKNILDCAFWNNVNKTSSEFNCVLLECVFELRRWDIFYCQWTDCGSFWFGKLSKKSLEFGCRTDELPSHELDIFVGLRHLFYLKLFCLFFSLILMKLLQ